MTVRVGVRVVASGCASCCAWVCDLLRVGVRVVASGCASCASLPCHTFNRKLDGELHANAGLATNVQHMDVACVGCAMRATWRQVSATCTQCLIESGETQRSNV